MKKNIKKKKSEDIASFCEALKAHDNYLLSCHVTPEGDAIGSIFAMDSLLRRLGKKTTIIAEDPFPERLFCLKSKRWKCIKDVKIRKHFDAFLVADCANLERIGKVQELIIPGTAIFNIDHHISNTYFGQHNFVMPQAGASGEVVFRIFEHLKMPLTKQEATSLYVAISTDTGSFKYGTTTIESHRIAMELIRTGINIEKINEQIYSTYSLNKVNLYSRLLARVRTTAGGRVAWVCMKREDLEHSGATYEDTEGFIDFLKFLKEVKIAFFLSEFAKKDGVRVSFRSKDAYDVNKIASHFNGGGHKKASGCRLNVPIDEAEKNILERIEKEFHS